MKKRINIVCLAAGLLPAWVILFMQYGGMEGDSEKKANEGNKESFCVEERAIWDGGSAYSNGMSHSLIEKNGADNMDRDARTSPLVEVFQGKNIRWDFGRDREEGCEEISYISFCQEWKEGKNGIRPITTIRIVRKNETCP